MIGTMTFAEPTLATDWTAPERLAQDDLVFSPAWVPCRHADAGMMREMAVLALQRTAPTYVVYSFGATTSVAATHRLFRFLAVGACDGDIPYTRRANMRRTQARITYKSYWLTLAQSGTAPLTFKQVGAIVDELSERLNRAEFGRIDDGLAAADPTIMSVEAVISVARTTYSARSNLSHWSKFVSRAKAALNARGVQSRVLAGLI